MKKGWKTVPLGELCDVLDHKRKPITKRDRESGEYPYYGATGVLDHVAGYLFDEPLVLVGEDGAKWASGENTAFAVEGKIWVNNHAHVLRPHRTVLLDNWLIYHLNHTDLIEFVSGLTVPKLNQGRLREIPIPVPPLAEQQRIVGLLDEAFEGLATTKANAKKNLQNARALFESHLQSVFTQRGLGWVEKRLDALAKFSQGIQIGLSDQSNAPAKGWVRFIRIIDYTQGTDDIRYVQDPGCRYWADKSDIVMVRYGTPGLVGRGIEGVIANNLFKISILDGSLTNDFLAYFLGQQTVQNYLSSQGSSTMPALTFTQLGAVMVSFPHEMEEQRGIATKLDSLREGTQRLARLYERKLAALEALKKSLLHQAFSGEL